MQVDPGIVIGLIGVIVVWILVDTRNLILEILRILNEQGEQKKYLYTYMYQWSRLAYSVTGCLEVPKFLTYAELFEELKPVLVKANDELDINEPLDITQFTVLAVCRG